MIPYDEALRRILDLPVLEGTEVVPLLAARGRRLAEAPLAPFDQPRFDNSAMDGYAVRARDLAGASPEHPVELPVAGESAAGRRHDGPIPPGHAIRISTGAPIPPELDGIVPIEETTATADGRVAFTKAPVPGMFRRAQGSDTRALSPLLERGRLIDSTALGFLASFNIPTVTVFRRPRVGILTSGNEIRPHGEDLGPDDIVGSSLYYLESELAECGCEARLFGIAPDDPERFAILFGAALEWSDILVTTAGVSVGNHDHLGEMVKRHGGQVHFWKVAVRPGKPMLVATYGRKVHFGLPGNPVSTCCNTEIFIKPYLRRLFALEPAPAPEMHQLAVDCPRDRARLFFVYGTLMGDGAASPLPNQNSGNMSLPARGNTLIVVEPGSEPLPKGTVVPVLPIRRGL